MRKNLLLSLINKNLVSKMSVCIDYDNFNHNDNFDLEVLQNKM